MKRIAINGMSRIGRAGFKVIFDTSELELVMVNDIIFIDNNCVLHGTLKKAFSQQEKLDKKLFEEIYQMI